MDKKVITVLGPVAPGELGITDAHNHLWISDLELPGERAPVLNQEELIRQELKDFKEAGGDAQVDCQPGMAGRDGRRLYRLSSNTGVQIIACTGFHLREYYPKDSSLWEMTADQSADYFLAEIYQGLEETRNTKAVVIPGFIKIAVKDSLKTSPIPLIEGAAAASLESGYLIEMHTEKGAGIDEFIDFFIQLGLPLERVVVCHIDKRPDLELHKELAQAGCLLEYDTFFRPKYHPEKHLWQLIPAMLAAGLDSAIALATDLADSSLWLSMGGKPGLAGFIRLVKTRLDQEIDDKAGIAKLMGENIANRLAVQHKENAA